MLSTNNDQLVSALSTIVGKRHVLVAAGKTLPFRRAYRGGEGPAICVVRPKTLLELWRVLQACIRADVVVVMQASNTSLTGGSTPIEIKGRGSVIISTRRLNDIQELRGTNQVIAFAGATLFDLERILSKSGRTPHSVIGSSCFGASVVGGVCNNSGGALVRRGPAYTELSLYARLSEDGNLILVNHLDVELGETPEEILTRLQEGDYGPSDLGKSDRKACASDYETIVRDIDQPVPARYNADPRWLYEASGCAGKLAVFAVRVDSFPHEGETNVVIVGANDPAAFADLRRDILGDRADLPTSVEYLHRATLDFAIRYGRDSVRLIEWIGTSRLPYVFSLKRRLDGFFEKLGFSPGAMSERLLQIFGRLTPNPLPKGLRMWARDFDHFLIVTTAGPSIDEVLNRLKAFNPRNALNFHACSAHEARRMALIRYAAAGASARYATLHRDEVEGVLALDVALRRNDRDWYERLPKEISDDLVGAYYYGHFLCHVFHQDYLVKKGVDVLDVKQRMLDLLEHRGAAYPAEHNVGHLYHANSTLQAHYRALDPTNTFNAGIGGLSKERFYGGEVDDRR